MSFSKYFTKEKNVVTSLISSTGRTALLMLLVMIFMIGGVGEVKADEDWPEEWQAHVRKLRAEGKDVKVMRSINMTPEKSPEEFLMRYKQVREQTGKSFTFQTFVEDVARGLIIEQRYIETGGVRYIEKENLNPNYYWRGKRLVFKCDKFCITSEILRNIFGKEDSIGRYLEPKKTESYRYYSLGTDFEIDFIPGVNKKCTYKIRFRSAFFYKMENR